MTNHIMRFTPSVKKARHLSPTVDKDKAFAFAEIVKRAYKSDPDPADINALQDWLDETPELWILVFDISQVIEQNLILHLAPEAAACPGIEKNVDEIRRDLGYENAAAMEKMLIDNIVVSWLRCQWTEYRLIMFTGASGVSSSMIMFWEKRLSVAQGRYLKAIETLAKVRKLSLKDPLLQLNIATQSGQQVNVAGDLIKK